MKLIEEPFPDRPPKSLKQAGIRVSSLTVLAGKIVRLGDFFSESKRKIKLSVRVVVHVKVLSETVDDLDCAVARFRMRPSLRV